MFELRCVERSHTQVQHGNMNPPARTHREGTLKGSRRCLFVYSGIKLGRMNISNFKDCNVTNAPFFPAKNISDTN